MMAIGQMTVEQFAGLYGNSNIDQEPICLLVDKWEVILLHTV
jgi:hypothetical protein